ncbi:MAG: hypothetical protein JWM74_6335 [Myxococcaceae bacterium]|nr:hypothetical protein [Myxococcaceae bacterium]
MPTARLGARRTDAPPMPSTTNRSKVWRRARMRQRVSRSSSGATPGHVRAALRAAQQAAQQAALQPAPRAAPPDGIRIAPVKPSRPLCRGTQGFSVQVGSVELVSSTVRYTRMFGRYRPAKSSASLPLNTERVPLRRPETWTRPHRSGRQCVRRPVGAGGRSSRSWWRARGRTDHAPRTGPRRSRASALGHQRRRGGEPRHEASKNVQPGLVGRPPHDDRAALETETKRGPGASPRSASHVSTLRAALLLPLHPERTQQNQIKGDEKSQAVPDTCRVS